MAPRNYRAENNRKIQKFKFKFYHVNHIHLVVVSTGVHRSKFRERSNIHTYNNLTVRTIQTGLDKWMLLCC